MSVANFMFAKHFCMYIMLYFHQKVLQRPIPWFNQKVNDFWCPFDAIICIIFLLLSSIPCSFICKTFAHINNRDGKQDFAEHKKQLESSMTKTVLILRATYTDLVLNHTALFLQFCFTSKLFK